MHSVTLCDSPVPGAGLTQAGEGQEERQPILGLVGWGCTDRDLAAHSPQTHGDPHSAPETRGSGPRDTPASEAEWAREAAHTKDSQNQTLGAGAPPFTCALSQVLWDQGHTAHPWVPG